VTAESAVNKAELARQLGVSRRSLYYHPVKPARDWELKCRIEEVLRDFPSYGHKRIALHLRLNKKRIRRVMLLFGMKPYRRRGRKPKRDKTISTREYPNLLMHTFPLHAGHIWVADFTYLPFQGRFVYLATVMDVFSREIVGWSVLTTHSAQLVLGALFAALQQHPRPSIFHSDNGREYASKGFIEALTLLGTAISRSKKSSPWENGYQESFYSQFKVDLGDPNRFQTLGELVFEIHRTIHRYNKFRIHSALRMSPSQFALAHAPATLQSILD
jgi:transposase InsO family protein